MPILLFGLTAFFIPSTYGQESQFPPDGEVSPEFHETDSYTNWKRLCTKPEDPGSQCHIYQVITDYNGMPVFSVRLFRIHDMEGVAALATFHTPLETYLKNGLKLRIGTEESIEHSYSWCNKQGCYAHVYISDDDLFTLNNTDRFVISIESVKASGYPIDLELSMADFSRAFSSLKIPDDPF